MQAKSFKLIINTQTLFKDKKKMYRCNNNKKKSTQPKEITEKQKT